MVSTVTNKKLFISYIFAFTLIIAMVAVAVLFEDREIILPEIAAMAIGMWAYREPGWIRQPSKIFLAPSITAVIGFGVNQLEIDYFVKIILTLILMFVFLRLIQSNLAPSIATGLLPVVTNATHWSFILAVFIFTFVIMLGVYLFEMNKGMEKNAKIQYKYMVVYVVLISIWIGLCWLVGYEVAVIPPILVVVFESLQKPMYNGKMVFKQSIVLTISATVGTLLYFAIDSLILVTVLYMILMYILLRIAKVQIPAAYAFPLLMFLFPDEIIAMMPLAALITCTILFTSVLMYKKYERKQNNKMKVNTI
ncbi:hypothetical protein [Bacillus sp. JJ722]|uniref:hypothetical protein n=1 Tax=Bacillus sp. JJ722 TaxID=3122973 RepID=UPI002FFD837C